MQNTNLSRRALFGNLFSRLTGNAQKKDPLFEKYSRKVYNGRRSSSLLYKARKPKLSSGNEALERVRPVTSGLAPYTGPWTTTEALHLLRRTGFGAKKSHVDAIIALPFSTAINTVLNIDQTPPPPPINYYARLNLDLLADADSVPYGADWTNSPFPTWYGGVNENYHRARSLSLWQFNLAINHDITIKEKMVLFWYHFIPVDFNVVQDFFEDYASTNSARICYKYMKLFRDNPILNFKALIRNIATHPAMMFYLNNQLNTKTAPDENFAREIMELFTLGKDSAATYTQADVIQAAKVLTGWRVQNLNTINESTNFISEFHEDSNKQFSSFFNNTVIPSSEDRRGAGELEEFIDMIFSKAEIVSQYICRRLYRFFVYYDIDAVTESNIIVPLAQHFVNNNWNMLPVLEKLFKSEHFFDMANRGVYIKSPLDLHIGTIRQFDVNCNVADPNDHVSQYELLGFLQEWFTQPIGQSIGKVPNVAGWPAFYQQPNFYENWINSDSTQRRFYMTGLFCSGFDTRYSEGPTTRIQIDVIAYIQHFSDAVCTDPNQLVSECIKYLFPLDLSLNQKDIIKTQTLLSNQTEDYYWSDAWQAYKSNPGDEMAKDLVQTRLRNMFTTILQYAEYQLM